MRASTHEPSERLRAILDHAEPDGVGTTNATSATRATSPPVLTPPAVVARSRWQVSHRAALGAGAVLLLAVMVLVGRTVLADRAAAPVPVAASPTGVTTGGDRSSFAPASSTPSGGSASARSSGEVYVHVVGRVRSPGVVRIPAGSRVADAVERAGGASGGADLTQVNLARVAVDGEQVVVPRQGEQVAPTPGAAGPGPAAAGGAPAGETGAALVPLNTADQAALEALPGVGPVLAERIIEWRTTNGGFTTVEELNEVSGIGEKLFAQISPKVSV